MKTTALTFLLLASASAFADNVTVYDKAPSVEELQRQLTGESEPAAPARRKMRSRAIVFGDPAPAAQPAAPQAAVIVAPAEPPPAAPIQQTAYAPAAPAPSVQAPIQASEKAIAFPINFQVNSADILPESIPFLESIAGLLNKAPEMRLVVEGHTDASGTSARNLALSRERAFSVMNYLVDQYRINPLRLVPVGKGFSEPLGSLEPHNPKNRRVQFRIIG